MDEKHLKTKKRLKIAGIVCLIVGGVCSIIGLIDLFVSGFFNGEMPKLFFLVFIGFPLLGLGSSLTAFGFKKEVSTYIKNETVPVTNEFLHDIKPGISMVKDAAKEEKISCPNCQNEIDKKAEFCPQCGKQLKKTCSICGNDKDPLDSNYCSKCGNKY